MFPLMMVIILIGTYIPALGSPEPNGIAVGVAGVDEGVVAAYQASIGDDVEFKLLSSAEEARQQVEDQKIGAALVVAPEATDLEAGTAYSSVVTVGDPTGVIYVATAAGSQRASRSALLLQDFALANGIESAGRNLVTTAPDDLAGIGSMFFALGMTLFAFSAIPSLGRVPNLFTVKGLAMVMAIMGAVVSVWVWVITHVIVGAVDGPFLPIFVTGMLTVFAVGYGSAFLTRLVGPMSILVALFLFIAMGITSSGASVPIDFTPGLYQFFHMILPFTASNTAIRNAIYFDGADLWQNWMVLAIWVVVMAAAFELMGRRQARAHDGGTAELAAAGTAVV